MDPRPAQYHRAELARLARRHRWPGVLPAVVALDTALATPAPAAHERALAALRTVLDQPLVGDGPARAGSCASRTAGSI